MLTLGAASRLLAAKEETWLRVATDEFTVITSLKEKEAAAWAGEFAQYVAALRNYFSASRHRLAPLTVVVFARERDFENYRPLGANGKPQPVAGFFLRHESWAVAGLAGADNSDAMRRTIFHEGVHWFLSGGEQANPVWLEEGLAEVFSTFTIAKKTAEWGRAIPEHVGLLRQREPLPLERLLFTGHGDLFGDDSDRTSLVYAESWALVHFLIFGQHGMPKTVLRDLTDARSRGENPDERFRRAFGKTYAEMDRLLARYMGNGTYFVRSQPLAEVAAPTIGPASRADVQDALARLALAARRWPLAAQHARAAAEAAPDDPRGDEVLGLALKENGDKAGALEAFGRAERKGTKNFQPLFELALAAHATESRLAGEVISLEPAEARRAATRYERAINLHPRFLASYQNLAGIIGVAEPWRGEDRKFLELGAQLYPADAMIQVGLALLSRRAGDLPGARTALDRVLNSEADGTAAARGFARQLDLAWEQEDIFAEINGLMKGEKFSEALAALEGHLARGVPAGLRSQLLPMRPQLKLAVRSQEIQRALNSGEWSVARRLLTEMIESDAPLPIKAQSRRSLEQLDRKKLGLEAKTPD